MVHHVTLEVDPAVIADEIRFWSAIAFAEVPVPAGLGEGFAWLEREGTQIHLISTTDPVVPPRGHVAVVAPEFDQTVGRLRGAGFEVRSARELWGEKRAKAISPCAHTVELMAAPPAPATG
jgi:hypothetical protein